METLMKSGKMADIYYNDETKKYEIVSSVSEMKFSYSSIKRANECWKDIERRFKIIKK